jgi:hypothetical protein
MELAGPIQARPLQANRGGQIVGSAIDETVEDMILATLMF